MVMEVEIKEDLSDSQPSEFPESIYKSHREFPYDLSNGIVDGVYLHLSERVSLRDKYWASMKNQIQVSYVMTRKVLRKTTRNKELPNALLQNDRKVTTELPRRICGFISGRSVGSLPSIASSAYSNPYNSSVKI
ncbi:jg95 [Pararge aegeria aegeria]|uniref:Jg95 protein n=1 Tax=Pararge aegeria aegeria TaxID=348720 RepID=A0A8S4QPB1_9NEOP|nr:jg95 [Pararge aegeria aegeria]